MPRPQFESVVAQAARKRLEHIVYEYTTSLAAGTAETVSFYAPENMVGRIVGLRFSMAAPVGAASGDHYVFVSYDIPDSTTNIDLMYGKAAYNALINFSNSDFRGTYSEISPSDNRQVVLANIAFDSEIPLVLQYVNNTNVATTALRRYFATVVYEEVAG